jgi:hypothetical protein
MRVKRTCTAAKWHRYSITSSVRANDQSFARTSIARSCFWICSIRRAAMTTENYGASPLVPARSHLPVTSPDTLFAIPEMTRAATLFPIRPPEPSNPWCRPSRAQRRRRRLIGASPRISRKAIRLHGGSVGAALSRTALRDPAGGQ